MRVVTARLQERRLRAENSGDKLSESDLEVMDLLLSWAAYGRPPEDDVAVRFGVSLDDLTRRVIAVIESADILSLAPPDRTVLVRTAKVVGARVSLVAPCLDQDQLTRVPLNHVKPSLPDRLLRRDEPPRFRC